MSILIKGMEMPRNCLSCPLQGGTADCRLTQKTYNWGLSERPSDCPLVPVPPHGRLIDADEMARKDNDDFLKIMEMSAPSTVFATALADAHTAIQEMLKNAPTIIPAEEGE